MTEAQPRKKWRIVDGVLLLDKPAGMSSNMALQKARRLFSAAKAGHTGTLDPMATGLLPVLFGEATKFSHMLLEADKTYRATLLLGKTTTTGDAEGELLAEATVDCDEAAVRAACLGFFGEIEQVPPMYSALKHEGRALYDYARQGIEIERKSRRVTVHELEIEAMALPSLTIRVRCSKGTYIRTLAEDIGTQLGCGAHLTALRRIASGPLAIAQAASLEQLESIAEHERVGRLHAVDSLLQHLPAVELEGVHEEKFSHGNAVPCVGDAGEVRVYGRSLGFMGLGTAGSDGILRAVRLIAQPEQAQTGSASSA